MLNAYEHEDADRLMKSVETVVEPMRELIARAQDGGAELIYYMTPLEYLLGQKEIDHLVLVGR